MVLNNVDYSLMTNKFSDNREKYLGYGESAAGIGCMLGPVLGSFFVINLGYCASFLFFAVMLSAAGILSLIVLPGKALNARLDVQND
jgi:MFS family permease